MQGAPAFLLSTAAGFDLFARRTPFTTGHPHDVSNPFFALRPHPRRRRCLRTANNYNKYARRVSVVEAKLRRSRRRVDTALKDVKVAWRRAGTVERLGLVVVATGAATLVATTIMHASAVIALFAFSVLLIPAVMTLAAAFGAVLLAAGAGTVGSLVILTPVFAVGSALKVAAEVAVVAAVGATIFTILGRKEDDNKNKNKYGNKYRSPYYDDDDEYDNDDDVYNRDAFSNVFFQDEEYKKGKKVRSWREEMFRSFDRALHERQGNNNNKSNIRGARWRRNFSHLQSWSVDDVIDQLYADGLGDFADLFDSERVDGAALVAMREADLRDELSGKVPLGMRVKLWRWIEIMQSKHAASNNNNN